MKRFKPIIDILVTVAQLGCFFLPFFLFYWPFYIYFYYFSKNKEKKFQAVTHYHTKMFYAVARRIIPGLDIKVHDREKIMSLRSSVIVCNHISFLDPLFLISMLKQTITISNDVYFHFPVFGWILKSSGYLSAKAESSEELWSERIIRKINETLKNGGNIFIFPEGTRSRNGKLRKFQKGAFYFAREVGAPIEILQIKGTDALYTPGKHLLNTCIKNTIELRYLGRFDTVENGKKKRVLDVRDGVYAILRQAEREAGK